MTELSVPHVPSLEQVQGVQAFLAQFEQSDRETRHHFADGLYAREIVLEADDYIVGKLHKTGHLNFLIEGEIEVWAPGQPKKLLRAPMVMPSEAGVKRIGHAITRVRWVTVHASVETDVAKLEIELIEREDIPLLENQYCLEVKE